MTLPFVQKLWPSNFDFLFSLVLPFQHCQMTQQRTFHISRGLWWWHKPSLWHQWRHICSENHFQVILTSYSSLCHRFNSVTFLSIKVSTHPVGCHGGASRPYGNNDVLFFPKSVSRQFWPSISRWTTVSTLSHNSSSNFPQTHWVAMVAKAVAIAKMTSYFVQKPWLSDFDPLYFIVPSFQHCHLTQHQTLYKPICLPW